jgi:hypothetical protein
MKWSKLFLLLPLSIMFLIGWFMYSIGSLVDDKKRRKKN